MIFNSNKKLADLISTNFLNKNSFDFDTKYQLQKI